MLFREAPENYTAIPTRTAAGCVALTRALVEAAAEDAPDVVKQRLGRMFYAGVALQDAWLAANRPHVPKVRPWDADRRLDRAWRKVFRRNQDWVELEIGDHERAAEVLTLVFPTGVDFLSLKYTEQWSASQMRLDLIASEGLEQDLASFVGADYLAELAEAHAVYGEVLGITTTVELEEDPTRVIDALLACRRAMTAYARLVFALADANEAEEVARAEAQLEPILRFRTPRVASEAEQEPVEDPIPAPLIGFDAIDDGSGA